MATYVTPNMETLSRFLASDLDAPVDLLNLLRFRDTASYHPEHKDAASGRSGRQAYRQYHLLVEPIFLELGASLAFVAVPVQVLVGPQDWHWDAAFVGRYPARRTIAALFGDPRYLEAEHHRSAALLDYRLLAMEPGTLAQGFDTFTAADR